MRFDKHMISMYLRPSDAPDLPEDELHRLQDEHLAHGARAQEQGLRIAGGPLADQDDVQFRGISVWLAEPEVVRAHLADDPLVRAGRLTFRLMTWMVPAGNITFHDVAHPRSMAEATGD